MSTLGVSEIVLILCCMIVVFLVILVIPYWQIFKKAGHPAAFGLLMCIPLVNLIMLYYLAFSDWPSLRQRQMENRAPV